METKKIILLALITIALIMSCTKQPYWEIPKDENGNAIITQVAKTTSPGISVLDASFTVNATLPNAKTGDIMTVELVKPQVPSWDPDGATQILPIAGSKKTATVDADLKISVSYTRTEATMVKAGDYVTVTIGGETESGILRIDLKSAFSVTKPRVAGKDVTIIRNADVANFEVKVTPVIAAYTATLQAKRKSGAKGTWIAVPGGPFAIPQPYLVPIAGTDFTTSDTMFYSFTATSGAFSEEYTTSIVVVNPFFFLLKKGVTLIIGGSSAGRNLLKNTAVAENNALASIVAKVAPSGSLVLQAGSTFPGTIEFVPSTLAKYTDNRSDIAKTDFAAGVSKPTADPSSGEGVYIFRIVNGTKTYYGMLKVTAIVPGGSISFDYRIGDLYSHLTDIQ